MAASRVLLQLSPHSPFSKGGNRLCFVHPEKPNRCLKILIPSSLPAARRRKKRFPANLRPLKYFDENLQEMHALSHLFESFPERITQHLPRSFGMVETDLGKAHQVSLIRDDNQLISQTLEQYLWANGIDDMARTALDQFKRDWLQGAPTTRDLLPHNLVLQRTAEMTKLVLIDGYGRKARIPWGANLIKKKNQKQIKRLEARIETVLKRRKEGDTPKPRISQLNREL
jgi:hypothetical protein